MNESSKIVPFKAVEQTQKSSVNGTVPNRKANDAIRNGRDYLYEHEIEAIVKVAKKGRNKDRDAMMIEMAFRHGLRVSELVDIRWNDLNLNQGRIHIRRLKGSISNEHPLKKTHKARLRKWKKALETAGQFVGTDFVFSNERGDPVTAAGFRKQLARWGAAAKVGFPVHPHQLRHSCGFKLANEGTDTRRLQAYLGHASITNTVRYTKISGKAFEGMWAD